MNETKGKQQVKTIETNRSTTPTTCATVGSVYVPHALIAQGGVLFDKSFAKIGVMMYWSSRFAN